MSKLYQRENEAVIINVYVQPGAKRTEIVGLYGDSLKIRLTSLPIDGRANDALLNFIAHLFDVSLSQVEIIRGSKSRHKKVTVRGSKIDPSSIKFTR